MSKEIVLGDFRITGKGRVTIPKKREELSVKDGDLI
jgi:bifunctional DNA-binding transcriptional regulator/antitoxin component of YhaV-PrlF toxin-antitoxin module